jgi:hypothetical protein
VLERSTRELDHHLDEWITHGGPSAKAEKEIRDLMASWLEYDAADLGVRSESDGIHFRHRGAAFLLERL